MPKSAAKPTPLRAVETRRDLAWIDDVPQASRTEVRELAAHLLEAGGTLTPADALQLTEYGRVAAEMRDAEELRRAALAEGDTKSWLALGRKLDACRTTQRGLLRDLRLTRNTAVSQDTKAAARKLAQRSGAGWEGVI
jgi:hypothetical protein